MDDALLNRNRRNFVAISMALFMVNLFGWQFPEAVSLLGNRFETSATVVHATAWVLCAYWGYEYLLCFAQRVVNWRDEWRKQLMIGLRRNTSLMKQITPERHEAATIHRDQEWKYDGLDLVFLDYLSDNILLVEVHLDATKVGTDPPKHLRHSCGQFKVAMSDIRVARFVTTVKLMFGNPTMLNLWLPWLVFALALGSELLRAIGFVMSGSDPIVGLGTSIPY